VDDCEFYVKGWRHQKDRRTFKIKWSRTNEYGEKEVALEKPRRAGDMTIEPVEPIMHRRTAQLYDHLIGRGQQAVRCCPSEGGDVVWIDLGSLRHTFPNDNNHTQVEQAMKQTLEGYRFKCPVKYLRTTDNGLTFWANTDDINMNEKFRGCDDPSELKKRSFADRSEWLRAQMARSNQANGELRVNVHRDNVLPESVDFICGQGLEMLHHTLKVIFINETSRYDDAGGITKGWIELLKSKIFTELPIFTYDDVADVYRIDPNSLPKLREQAKQAEQALQDSTESVNRGSSRRMNSHFQILHFVGRLMGKVLMEGERFPIALSPVIYKGLLQQTLRFDDLHEINKDMYDRLAAMRDDTHYFENHPEFEDMLVFAGEIDGKEIALKHNGLNIVVNDENMMGYVEKMFEFQVRKQFKDELTNLLCGFWEVVHPHLIQSFSWSELQILLCGVMELDLDDWRANTKYKSGYSENDQVIKWFWEILQDMTPDERVLILQFVTGSQSVPASGFAGLADTHGLFCINKVKYGTKAQGGVSMPIAHTCFNIVDLPEFTDKQTMEKMLVLARDLGMQNEFIKE